MSKTPSSFWRVIWGAEYGLVAIGSGLSLLAIMLVTVLSVAGRYLFHTDLIPGAYNLIERVLFPLMVFWALPVAHRDGMFPKLELVMGASLSHRARAVVALFVGLVELMVYGVLIYFIWIFVERAMIANRTVMIGVETWPMWPIAIMMPLAFGLMMLEMVRLIWRDVQIIRTGRPVQDDTDFGPPAETL
ncbi:TRAP transporter small permease [Falsigemmobacter intermedius]|uniref:TRAP transporter small permease protein n=1 Tax=Falsigemmobacter intermedius TaxID=1553448 RepID=A0A3S3VPA3_9RHOB|nr:TRAP transporter small permease [Falsigemmobacter intermedius]RWY39914.1 TRAP transporter small permease [Falsigemmobacter intermedius]